jgi:cytochrome c-type biogenesis protein CcmH/NrfG
MQVALPQLHEDWPKLMEVSQNWIKAEPSNSEAWYELGVAQEGLGKADEAEAAYRKAASMDPRHGDALFRLGVFASRRGDREEMHQVSTTLAQIDSEMAFEFNKEVGCEKEC